MDSDTDIPATTVDVDAWLQNLQFQQRTWEGASETHSPTTLHTRKSSGTPSTYRLLRDLMTSPSSSSATQTYKTKALRRAYQGPLDRVNVLGDDEGYGHTGCVNALSWALNGDVLISGGDDKTLRLWRLDPNDISSPYPYKQCSIIYTGHAGNIFNAHLLPSSSRIVSVAADRQVRVFDVERALTTPRQAQGAYFNESETCIRVLKCHDGRTKRVVTEESSDLFLTVAEDGTVRQHDLRTPHVCGRKQGGCPPPLVSLPHDLSTLALSPLAPYLFVVAGESPFGYLFDRRQIGRNLQAEWGVPCSDDDYVTCVRRFGRAQRAPEEGRGAEHITGARMAQTNAHEVLLTYRADAIFLYSTRDEPQGSAARLSSVLPPNRKRFKSSLSELDLNSGDNSTSDGEGRTYITSHGADSMQNEEDVDDESGVDEAYLLGLEEKFKSPVILPRRRFAGHSNVETVKDVNFIGAEDEYVASGSDDGNFFLWEKATGRLHGIYEGDANVVNVIESHPRLPLVACSGIDTTVKLFAPTEKDSAFSRLHHAEDIMSRNSASARRSARTQMGFANLFMQYRMALRRVAEDESEGAEPQCTFQ